MPARFVIIESPYAGDVQRNEKYARMAMKDSLQRGEAPYLSHLLYTQVLDDTIQEERTMGIKAGLAIGRHAEATIVYHDYGTSTGMQCGIDRARKEGRPVEFRYLFNTQ